MSFGLLDYGTSRYGGVSAPVDPFSLHTRLGGLAYPLDPADFETTLAPLDPARDTMLGLFRAAINAQLGAVWTKVTNTLPAGHYLRDTSPVQDTLQVAPDAGAMVQREAGWPLLILFRDGTGTYDQRTLFVDSLTQPWQLHYILGPLSSPDETHKPGDALIAAAKIIRTTIAQQGHPAYQDGAVQFGGDAGSLSRVDLKSHEGPGAARFAGKDDGPLYYALSMLLETEEVTNEDVDAYSTIDEFATVATLEDSDGASEVTVLGDSDAATPSHS